MLSPNAYRTANLAVIFIATHYKINEQKEYSS